MTLRGSGPVPSQPKLLLQDRVSKTATREEPGRAGKASSSRTGSEPWSCEDQGEEPTRGFGWKPRGLGTRGFRVKTGRFGVVGQNSRFVTVLSRKSVGTWVSVLDGFTEWQNFDCSGLVDPAAVRQNPRAALSVCPDHSGIWSRCQAASSSVVEGGGAWERQSALPPSSGGLFLSTSRSSLPSIVDLFRARFLQEV